MKHSAQIGSRPVRKAIDAAETKFKTCWDILSALKNQKPTAGRLIEFQPILAQALYDLEQTYERVVHFRDHLISTKTKHESTQFVRRLRLLNEYKKAIEETMRVGRSLGDAFAWLFYNNSPQMLRKHSAHSPIRHFPTGVGGRGEVEFIRHARAEKHLLLHHGITSFLRMGDISFVDISTRTVVGLGELKSHSNGLQETNVTLIAISKDRNDIPRLYSIPGKLERGSDHDRPPTTERFKTRMKRQMSGMSSSLVNNEPDSKKALFGANYVDELSELGREVLRGRPTQIRVGQGGVLAAVMPYKSKKLSSRLLGRQSGAKAISQLKGLEKLIHEASDPNSAENSLNMGELRTEYGWGAMPFFWWPVSVDFLEKLYFGEVTIFSIFNPVYLIANLRASGFEVTNTHSQVPTVRKYVQDGIVDIENFSFFMSAVHRYLWREDKIMEVLNTMVKEAESRGTPGRINIDIVPQL
jgi:hypothetical protein